MIDSVSRMPDGKLWTTSNLNLESAESYCHADASACRSRKAGLRPRELLYAPGGLARSLARTKRSCSRTPSNSGDVM